MKMITACAAVLTGVLCFSSVRAEKTRPDTHPEWGALSALFGVDVRSVEFESFANKHSLKKIQKFDEGALFSERPCLLHHVQEACRFDNRSQSQCALFPSCLLASLFPCPLWTILRDFTQEGRRRTGRGCGGPWRFREEGRIPVSSLLFDEDERLESIYVYRDKKESQPEEERGR